MLKAFKLNFQYDGNPLKAFAIHMYTSILVHLTVHSFIIQYQIQGNSNVLRKPKTLYIL